MKAAECTAACAAAMIAWLAGAEGTRADNQPVIAVPGNWQVPVVINGMPATGALVVGDWGLYAPGRVVPEIYAPVLLPIEPDRAFFPTAGRRPRYGRQEVLVRRHFYPQAPSFHRAWSTESGRGPVTEYPPFEPPPVIMGPRSRQ